MALGPARILITSNGSLLAGALRRAFATDEVIILESKEHDDFKKWEISAIISELRPDLVIHLGVVDDISQFELSHSSAFETNYVGSHNIALGCKAAHASLVYLSSGYIFQGGLEVQYSEYDAPNADSVYGKSILACERVVQQTLNEFYIVRTSWLFGNNFYPGSRDELILESDSSVVGSPTYVVDLARRISLLVRSGRYGIYHMANEGTCTLKEFRETFQDMLPSYLNLVEAFPLDMRSIDKTKSCGVLRNSVASGQFNFWFRNWRDALAEYIDVRKTYVR